MAELPFDREEFASAQAFFRGWSAAQRHNADRRCGLSHKHCKRSEDIAAGDVVLFFGTPHMVHTIEPYTGPFEFIIGVARSRDGWGISLEANRCVEVA